MKNSLFKTLFLTFILPLFLYSCGTTTISTNYAPSTTMTATGRAQVGEFRYIPSETVAEGKKSVLKPNQIRNTAIGQILIDKNISQFYRDALFTEMRFSGVNVNSSPLLVSGEIEDFTADDLGYSIDWILKTKIRVTKAGQKTPIYEQTKTTQRKTEKFGNFHAAINETVKLNIEELLKDNQFRNAIK